MTVETLEIGGQTIEFLTPAEGFVEGSGWRRIGPGDALAIPGNAKHAWRNEGDEPAVMIVVTTANLGRFLREVADASLEEFLATADRYGFWNSISG
jgi:oxalate decarboxylase/phosphoglucose isomerase-like protein (cupin superfamily)